MSDERLSDAERWLAAEHALGLTEGAAHADAERRVERDPGFRDAVEGWHAQLEPLVDEIEPVAPPERVLRALEREIAEPRSAAPGPRIAPWRAFALLGLGAALGAGVVAAWLGGVAVPPEEPTLVATLLPEGDSPAAVVRLDREGDVLVVRLSAIDRAERVPELWLIPGDGVPRSLGTVEEETAGELRLPLDRLGDVTPAPGDALAVSLEPPGGSPTGAPTGPIVALGALIEL